MKDKVISAYSEPAVEIVNLDNKDVICTSGALRASKNLLGTTQWQSEWSDTVGLEGGL